MTVMTMATVGGVSVRRRDDSRTFFWQGPLACDADGSPKAYHPNGCPPGLDELANAGKPGNWWGVIGTSGPKCPQAGLYIQGTSPTHGDTDPFPGFYVSCTALTDPRYASTDPRRYVDSSSIPYVSLPPELGVLNSGAMKGDIGMVVYNGIACPVIYAEVGPRGSLGEGSIALHQALGVNPFSKPGRLVGLDSGVSFVLFPGTGTQHPLPYDQIISLATAAFCAFGGTDALLSALS